jgi:hypothetical protein
VTGDREVTLQEFEQQVKNLREGSEDDENDSGDQRLSDGSTLRVVMPDGSQLDVIGVSVQDAAAKQTGEGFLALRLDQPMGA